MKKNLLLAAIIIQLIFLSCQEKEKIRIQDRAGREVEMISGIKRIISASPSNTEILMDLGQAEKLIAVDKYSASIEGLPLDIPTIDFLYPDAEVIVQMQPDLIIANGHNATGTGEDPFALLKETGIAVVYLSMSKSIQDIYLDIGFIANLVDAKEKGNELIESMKIQIDRIANNTKNISEQKTVYLEISAAPLMMSFGKNSYINDMIQTINAKNIFADQNWLTQPSAEAIIEKNPDVILTSVDYLEDPAAEIKSRIGFGEINAVKNNQVFYIDTNSLVRPSSRIIKALEQMSMAVYPEGSTDFYEK
jgi:iron complex transport system substrate-binding protein